jgi:hypothetical protein
MIGKCGNIFIMRCIVVPKDKSFAGIHILKPVLIKKKFFAFSHNINSEFKKDKVNEG